MYKKNPRKDSRERTIENIRKKIAPIFRTNGHQKEQKRNRYDNIINLRNPEPVKKRRKSRDIIYRH